MDIMIKVIRRNSSLPGTHRYLDILLSWFCVLAFHKHVLTYTHTHTHTHTHTQVESVLTGNKETHCLESLRCPTVDLTDLGVSHGERRSFHQLKPKVRLLFIQSVQKYLCHSHIRGIYFI